MQSYTASPHALPHIPNMHVYFAHNV